MDAEAILDATLLTEQTVWHPILSTCREELREACKRSGGGLTKTSDELVAYLTECSDEQVEHAARKLGDVLMEGGDYWEGIPYAVERAMP